MSIFSTLFGSKKPAAVEPERVNEIVSAEPHLARPIRVAVYREASITYESGYSRKGVVMDFADKGLRIRFPTNEALPPVVNVHARAVGLQGEADLIWQNNSEVGLRVRG
jgi:hypothetical protein